MKKIKKNLFGIGLGLAIILGVGLSFAPINVYAEGGSGGGCPENQIPCYSASIASENCDYIDCLTCARRDNRRYQGVDGCCTPSPPD